MTGSVQAVFSGEPGDRGKIGWFKAYATWN